MCSQQHQAQNIVSCKINCKTLKKHLFSWQSIVFNNVRELLNMKQFTYYDPKLQLFKDFQERLQEYEQIGVAGTLSFQDAMYTLQYYIDIKYRKDWCQDSMNRLKQELPDVDQFFNRQKTNYFKPYQYELDELTQFASKITNTDTSEQIRAKIGNNNTYFTINNEKQLSKGIPFTNPMIYSQFSKDSVYIFDNFEEINIINSTILESSSLIDRIWIYIIKENQIINIFDKLFKVKYLSLTQVMILQQNITEFIKQNTKYQNIVNNFQFIQHIYKEIENQNQGSNYKIKNGSNIIFSTSYTVVFLFTKYCNYISSGLPLDQNLIVILVSKEQCNYYIQRFYEHIKLFYRYQDENHYLNSSLNSIIQYLNQLFYDETPKIGNINNTMLFMKPVYIESVYVGCLYKLVEYTQYLAFSMFSVDKVSRTTILDSKTQRTLIDYFAEYSSPIFVTKGNSQSFYSFQPVIFNQLDINTNNSDYIQVTKQKVLNIIESDIFMITDPVKYQKQFKFKEYTAINTVSSTFLGQMVRLPFQICSITEQNYIEQQQLFDNYVSATQIDFQKLRAIASSSHTSIQNNNEQGYVSNTSSFLNYQTLMKESFHINKPISRCQIPKQSMFNLHSYYEILLNNFKNLKNSGNISYFINQIEEFQYLISIDKYQDGLQLPLINLIFRNLYLSTQILSDFQYLHQLKKVVGNKIEDIQYDEIVSEETIVVIPIIVLDIYQRLYDISLFSALTNKLKKLTQYINLDISEIVISSVNIDNAASQYRTLFDNQYDQYLADYYSQKTEDVQQIILERINFYKYIIDVYSLHQFSYSTSKNWESIMREQLKSQPSALTEKFRVGQFNGKLSVTKALTVQSKTLDNQTTVSGFLTVVLKQSYKVPVEEPYTLFDSNMRYIAGIDDQQYFNGVKQVLFRNNYIKSIKVNQTLANMQNILELNNGFWIDAFQKSREKKFTLIITQNKTTYQNRISERNYNESEIHQRSIIFDANCDYLVSGKIIVKQLGAIDGIMVIYKDIVLSNYNQDLLLVDANVFSLDQVSYYYGNLNNRLRSTTYYTNYMFNNNKNNKILGLSRLEITTIIYLIFVPLLILIIASFCKAMSSNHSYKYYSEEQITKTSTDKLVHRPRRINNYICQINCVKSQIFYNIDLESTNIQEIVPRLLFANDLSKYLLVQNQKTHEQIYEYLITITENNTQLNEQINTFSFKILVSSQQYSIIINSLQHNKSWLPNNLISFTGSIQVWYRSVYRSLLKTYKTNSKQSNNQEYVSKVFDDNNLFIDRKLNSPCNVSILSFRSCKITYNTPLIELLESFKK
ncbi:Conserved_hypothetical protein [Hexamita inflata]|uniref:Transmembrane protein n=1 Tax=Hexamita inflata TaxID=28002 RepID=A0AA86PDG1_9EUKA|nr:Conserved hypothetical protein [Hexamita inflata]